jgi:splicing factor 3B subunit 3
VHLDNNEAAFSLAIVPFEARSNELLLVVGTAQDTLLSPRSCTSGFLRVYKFTEEGADLELLHKVGILARWPNFEFVSSHHIDGGR